MIKMQNRLKNIIILLLILIMGIFSVILYFMYQENKELQEQLFTSKKEYKKNITQKEKKTQELILLAKEIQQKNDSLKGKSSSDYKYIDGITIGTNPISLEQLISIANKIMNENSKLKKKIFDDSLTIRKHKEILKKLEDGKLINNNMNDKMQGNLSYVNLNKYQEQIKRSDSIINIKNNDIKKYRDELQAKNSILNLIKKNYEIDYEIEDRKNDFTVRLLNTKKLDSALSLFPYYKHKIKTNKRGETVIR